MYQRLCIARNFIVYSISNIKHFIDYFECCSAYVQIRKIGCGSSLRRKLFLAREDSVVVSNLGGAIAKNIPVM